MTATIVTPPAPTRLDPADWVPAAPFRAHFRQLVEQAGLPWRVVALAAALPAPTAQRLLRPSTRSGERIRLVDARTLYGLTPEALAHHLAQRVPAGRACRTVLRLRRLGWAQAEIARRAGVSPSVVKRLSCGDLDLCTRETSLRLAALRDELLNARPATVGANPAAGGEPWPDLAA